MSTVVATEEAAELIPLNQFISLGYPGLGMIGAIQPADEEREVSEWRPSPSEMESGGPAFITGEIDVLNIIRALDHRIPLPIGHLLSISEQANHRMLQHCKANRKRLALTKLAMVKGKAPAKEAKPDAPGTSEPVRPGLIQKSDRFLRIKAIPWKSAECDVEIWGVPYNAIIDSGAAVLAISLRVVERAGRRKNLIPLTEGDRLISADEEKIRAVERMTNVAFRLGKVHALGDVVVLNVSSYDVLLGLPALNALQANLDFERRVVVLKNTGGKPYTIPMRLTLRTTVGSTCRTHPDTVGSIRMITWEGLADDSKTSREGQMSSPPEDSESEEETDPTIQELTRKVISYPVRQKTTKTFVLTKERARRIQALIIGEPLVQVSRMPDSSKPPRTLYEGATLLLPRYLDKRSFCDVTDLPPRALLTVEKEWTWDSKHNVVTEDVELLIIQAWRTEVEGDLLGFVFGSVEAGHRQPIVGELLILLTQLVDDLPIDIISHCDESSAPHILSRSLTSYLQWSACLEAIGTTVITCRMVLLKMRATNQEVIERHEKIAIEVARTPTNAEEVVQLRRYASSCPNELKALDKLVSETKHRESFLADYYYDIPDEDFRLMMSAYEWPKRVQVVLDIHVKKIEDEHERFENALKQRRTSFAALLEQYREQVLAFRTYGEAEKMDQYAEMAKELVSNLTAAQATAASINAEEMLFSLSVSKYQQLAQTISDIDPFVKLWTTAAGFRSKEQEWMNAPFASLDLEIIENEVTTMQRMMYKLSKQFAEELPEPAKVATSVKANIEKFKTLLPLFSCLCNPGMWAWLGLAWFTCSLLPSCFFTLHASRAM
ncbi:hypothetical protein CBR_g51372 [Chara braunii]|uniref:Dynein heavy chain linker domain-containing protein n=1 Tax=Chara braunii TaxID=69332 RepID=A0A388M8J5_CHABU|nr:hypothetical protein CBR_g51372 [Chara braunii]|eukprot:GBG90866.1 hypothetical protein CBR_g51372 [Chara braunii]